MFLKFKGIAYCIIHIVLLTIYQCSGYSQPSEDFPSYDSDDFNYTQLLQNYGYGESYNMPMSVGQSWTSKADASGNCQDGTCSSPYSTYYGSYDAAANIDIKFVWDNCFITNGVIKVNGTSSCDLRVAGANEQADRLPSGIDGVYRLTSCHWGKPLYRREDAIGSEARVLWYNAEYGDWTFSIGKEPRMEQLVMYGDYGHLSPMDVPSWHLAADLNSAQSQLLPTEEDDLYFIAEGISVTCVGESHHTDYQ